MSSYPWYERTRGDELAQGDLLPGLPVVVPAADLSFPLPDRVPAEVLDYDTVVMTQSCDLENEKVRDVILCPHWSLEDAAKMEPAMRGKTKAEEIRKGRRPRYLLLGPSEIEGLPLQPRVVDFGRIFSLPKPYVQDFAATLGPRLRLCPPYREHLAQGFARFFMRVGLPQDIRI